VADLSFKNLGNTPPPRACGYASSEVQGADEGIFNEGIIDQGQS